MLPSRYSVWIYRAIVTTIFLLGIQPSHVAAQSQGDLSGVGNSYGNFVSRNAIANSIVQTDEETAYALQPLASSAQEQPESGQSYLGLNPAQALQIVFAPEGLDISAQPSGDLDWHLGWQLEGAAREGDAAASRATAVTVVVGNSIQYQYDETLTEWYINDEKGLKQGFTLYSPPTAPSGDALLQIRLQLESNLTPVLSNQGQAIDFVTTNGAALLRYDGLHVFDAAQTTLPAYFSLTPTGIAINVDDSEALYPITIDPLLTTHLKKRIAADAAADDFLGYDVNVSQGIAIVGVYGDDNENGVDAGVVYLHGNHQGGADNWGELARLVADDGEAGDQFGKDVYITFGVTATVGAPGDDDMGDGAGAAYLYARNHGGNNAWGQLAKFTPNDGAAGDAFGSAVSVQRSTHVVGAPGHAANGNGSGAVYIYEQTDPADSLSWEFTKKIVAPDGEAGDGFGTSLVNSDDYLIIGAPYDDDACPQDADCDSGSIYIFERNLGGADAWGLLHKRTVEGAAAGDQFGMSLNFSTDRVIVGAPGDDEKASNAGAAYIFERDRGGDNAWGQRTKMMAPDGAADDQFGRSVGLGGNIAIIGAPFDDDNGDDSGSAYLVFYRFTGAQGEWGNVFKIAAADGAAGAQFGSSVDQRSGNIVVGAPMESEGGSHAGAAYFYTTPFDVGTLQIANNVEPNDPDTNFVYAFEGILSHSENIVGDSQSAPALLFPGTYTVTESAGANTDLSQYATTWACTTDGVPSESGSGSVLSIFVGLRQHVVCNFTHARPGTITIVKETKPAGGTGFSFTDTITSPNSFTLDDQGSQTFTDLAQGLYEVTENLPADWRLSSILCPDLDGGSNANGTTATIDLDAGEGVVCTFTNKFKDGISVIKSADVTAASIGQTVTYSYSVFNDSADTLSDIVAVDDKLGVVTLDQTTLAPDGQATGTLTYTIQASDLPGPIVNTVTVTGTPPAGPLVTDHSALSVNIVGNASIALSVAANPSRATVDDSITYSYWITNTGETLLTDLHAEDDRLGTISLVDTSLQPGESTDGTLVYTVVGDDLPGPLVNTAIVTGTTPLGLEAGDSAMVSVELNMEPALELAVTTSVSTANVGDTITYTYQVANSGTVALSNVTATDNRLGAVPLATDTLAPGATTTGTLVYTVLAGDLPGPLVNAVTAQGRPPVGPDVEREVTVSVQLSAPNEESSINLPLILNR